jgi:hypothetical protein
MELLFIMGIILFCVGIAKYTELSRQDNYNYLDDYKNDKDDF